MERLSQKAADDMLFSVLKIGSVSGVEKALAYGADPDCRDVRETPALVLAVHKNEVRLVEALLEAGADPDVLWKGGTILEHAAVQNETVEILKALLEADASLDLGGCLGERIKRGEISSTWGPLLREALRQVMAEDRRFPTEEWLPGLVLSAVQLDELGLLDRMGALPGMTEWLRQEGVELLLSALENKSPETFFWLLGRGAASGDRDSKLELMKQAVKSGQRTVLEVLLVREPVFTEEELEPVLETAVGASNVDLVERLLTLGVRPTGKSFDLVARVSGLEGLEIFRALFLRERFSPEVGKDLLRTAASHKNRLVLEALLEQGLVREDLPLQAELLLTVARSGGFAKEQRLCIELVLGWSGADLFYEGEPLVYYAARKGYIRLARYLARWREIPDGSPADELAVRRMLRTTEQYQAELEKIESPDRELLEQYPEFDMEDLLLVRRIGIIGAGMDYSSTKIDGYGISTVRKLEMGIWNPFEGNIFAIEKLFDRHGLPWNRSCGLARVARFEDVLFGGRFADFVSRALYLAGRFSCCHLERKEYDDEWERPMEPEWT